MQTSTDICCGSGIIRTSSIELIEIEVIAFSKSSRYVYFEISQASAHHRPTVALLCDSQFRKEGFEKLGRVQLWIRRTFEGTYVGRGSSRAQAHACADVDSIACEAPWERLDKNQVTYSPQRIEFELDVAPGERVEITTEPPRPYPQTVIMLENLVKMNPSTCQLHVIGRSIENRPIFLLRITEDVARFGIPGQESRPVVLLISGEHATEFAGEEVTRGMLKAVIGDERGQVDLRRRYVFDFVLNCNPDGNVNGWHQYNANDWMEHDYTPGVDRSWHHEFGPYLSGKTQEVSPETRALGDWINSTNPQFVHTAHSWEGNGGKVGVYRVDPELACPTMAQKIRAIESSAASVAQKISLDMVIRSLTSVCTGHLPQYLTLERNVPACSIEAHPDIDRSVLQRFGELILPAWIDVALRSQS